MSRKYYTHIFWSTVTRVLTTTIIAYSGAIAVPANAQQDSESEGGSEATRTLDTVLVQARKRTENIIDVPVAITSLSEEAADDLVLDDITDYLRQVPGAILVASGPAYLNDISLRGQGGGRTGFGESSTGIYRDGIYVAGGGFGGRTFSDIDFFDMQTLEIYRGPQGALYGRNAVGGAANLITNKPTDELGFQVRAGLSDPEMWNASLIANIPLSERFDTRFGGYVKERRDGFHKVQSTGQSTDTTESWGARGAIAWDMDDLSDFLFTVEHSSFEGPAFASTAQNLVLDPDPYTRVGLDFLDRTTIEQTSLFGKYTRELGIGDLTVLVNYKTRDGKREKGDLAHFIGIDTPLLVLEDAQAEDFTRHGGELRIASRQSSGTTWLFGADYQVYESRVDAQRRGEFSGPFNFSAVLRGLVYRDQSTEDLLSYSAFGLVGFDLAPRLNLTIEGRVQRDEKDFVFERIDLDTFTPNAIPQVSFGQTKVKFTPTVSLRYELSEQQTVYGRIASGYRPGGFNLQPQPGFFDKTAFGPETAYSAELGWKTNLQLGRVSLRSDLAAFYTLTDDIQNLSALTTTTTVAPLQNVGDAVIYGAEFTFLASTQLMGGDVTTNFGLSSASGEFQSGSSVISNGQVFDLEGVRTPRNRDFIVNLSLNYVHPINDRLDGFGTISFQSEGGGYDNPIGGLKVAGSRSSDHFAMYDARLGVRAENWKFSVFGKNIGDEVYRTVTLSGNAFHNDPRVVGAELAFEF